MEPTSKPLSYGTQYIVMKYMSFENRCRFYRISPSIRNMEAKIPYRLDYVSISFSKLKFNTIGFRLTDPRYTFFGYALENFDLKKVAEILAMYYLNRPGTSIKNLELKDAPSSVLRLSPVNLKNLIFHECSVPPESYCTWIKTTKPVENVSTNRIFGDNTIKNAKNVIVRESRSLGIQFPMTIQIHCDILAEWNCTKLVIHQELTIQKISDYCRITVARSRPIGTTLRFLVQLYHCPQTLLSALQNSVKGRWTKLNGRFCLTLPIDDSTELNMYAISDPFWSQHKLNGIEIRVNPKGTSTAWAPPRFS